MNKKLKYEIILFDMDGTLADTDGIILETYHELFKLYNKDKNISDETILTFSGPPLSKTLKEQFPHLEYDFIYKEYIRISTPKYYQILKGYEGEKDTLKYLKDNGVKLGIVTNKRHNLSEECIKILNLDGIFDVVIGSDDVLFPKPNKEGILKACDYFNYHNIDKILYVGDNDIDFETASNAHIKCALVTWGPRKINKTLKVDHFIDKFEKLKEIIYE